MKKIKYYEAMREKEKNGDFKFQLFEGYLQEFYDSETDTVINIVFRNDDKLRWKATHLESGVLIISGFDSRKRCMEGMLTKVHIVAKIIQKGDVKKLIETLENHRNKELFKYATY